MTEMSPVGTCGRLKPKMRDLPVDQRHAIQAKQGRAICGVDMKIVDADGRTLPHDGKSFGELLVRGPWVISAYFNDAAASKDAFDDEGWFRTGDVATIDRRGLHADHRPRQGRRSSRAASGSARSTSRTWRWAIPTSPRPRSSASPHPKWDERPLLVVVKKPGSSPTREEILGFLKGKVANWCAARRCGVRRAAAAHRDRQAVEARDPPAAQGLSLAGRNPPAGLSRERAPRRPGRGPGGAAARVHGRASSIRTRRPTAISMPPAPTAGRRRRSWRR